MTVFNKQATQRFWDAMRTRRVDFVDISDSNCLFGGHGRNHGLSYAFSTLGIPIYRTQVFSAAENRNVGSSSGYKSGAINDGGRLNRIGNAPAELDMYMPDNGTPTGEGQWAPSHNYWYLRSGDTYTNGNNGIVIDADNPVGVNGNLRAWFTYGELADVPGGAIRPAIRRGDSPFTELVNAGLIDPSGKSANAIKRISLDLAAATRNYPLQVRWQTSNNQIVGPMIQFYQSLENRDTLTGIGVHYLLGRGGQGYVHFLKNLRRSIKATAYFLDEATFMQNVPLNQRMIMISLNSGLNDRNITGEPSLGPVGGLASATAAGFADNLEGMILHLRDAWTLIGGDPANLYFTLFDSTPVSNPDEATLISYRNESRRLAAKYQNTCELDLTLEQPTIETNAAAWYASGGSDRYHMTQTGYEQVMLLAVSRLTQGAGKADDLIGPMPSPKSIKFRQWVNDLIAYRTRSTTAPRTTTYYFSTTGNDVSGDGSQGNPFATVSKAITLLAAGTGGMAFLFKRGDQWNETTLMTLNKPNCTVGAWGTASNKPWFNRFTLKYNSAGWTLAAGNRYTRAETTDMAWLRYQDYLQSKDPALCLKLVSSSAECEANSNTFFWGANVLHVNLGGTNPNTLNLEACPTNTANGFDVTATGCRIEGIRVDGWGMSVANPHSPQSYQIRWALPTNGVGSASNCETFYGGTHLHAIYNPGATALGGAVLIEDCDAGFALQGGAGETIFNTYVTLGECETIFNRCKVVAGTLPNGVAAWAVRGKAFYGHTAGVGKHDLIICNDCEIIDSAITTQNTADFADTRPAISIETCRTFIIGEVHIGRAVPWTPYLNTCYINCFWDITPAIDYPAGGYSAAGASSQEFDGYWINCTWRVNQINQASTTRRALFNALGTTNECQFLHCRLHITQTDNAFGIDYDANGADSAPNAVFANTIYTAEVASGAVTVALNNTAGKCFNNAYRNITGGAGTSNRFDYGNHANKIELTSDLDYDNFTLPSSHPCARAGAVNIRVEYDRFWRLRNLSAPSIGPVEAL